jgi:hypothetical protein
VLEETGVVSRVIRGRTHMLSLESPALEGAADWMDRQRAVWTRLFDVVEDHLAGDDRTHTERIEEKLGC